MPRNLYPNTMREKMKFEIEWYTCSMGSRFTRNRLGGGRGKIDEYLFHPQRRVDAIHVDWPRVATNGGLMETSLHIGVTA